jgi:hypothetical protein
MKSRSVTLAAFVHLAASVLPAMAAATDAVLPQSAVTSPTLVAEMMMSRATQLTKDAGRFRVVMAVLPAEPFLTAAQAAHGGAGMVAVGGALPVDPSAPSHPNHHLVIHVFDRADGHVLRGGHVTMSFTRLGRTSTRSAPVIVPVVEMEAAGKGPPSTHYGNNVFMPAGAYRVAVSINGSARTVFTVEVM